MAQIDKKWSLVNPPPEGNKDVADWAWDLFEIAKAEKKRLMLPERWLESYKLYRGDHWQEKGVRKNKKKTTINLYFANIERTKANITAREPAAEIIDLEGNSSEGAHALTTEMRAWWKNTNQQKKLTTTALKMEKYGITIEKAYLDTAKWRADISIIDPYAFFPAPGNWEDIGYDCPYICHAYPEPIEAIEKMFNVSGVEEDDIYSILGDERKDAVPPPVGAGGETVRYSGNYNEIEQKGKEGPLDQKRALVVEIWLWDNSFKTENVPILDENGIPQKDEIGNILVESKRVPKYPGGIRVISLTRSGRKIKDGVSQGPIVLDDKQNPNINLNLPLNKVSKSYLYNRFPFYVANSYEDTTSLWGFSASEQVGDLNYKIDELFSRLMSYASRAMYPVLVVPKDTGITPEQINNKPSLLLRPSNSATAAGIRFVPVPNLPNTFFNIINMIIGFFDRTYQIEDADRGVAPKGVVAASAIVALQERNATLLQHKERAIVYLAEQRGKCALSLKQNFGTRPQKIKVDEKQVTFYGTDYLGKQFGYVVEAGSTMPKTSLQVAAQSEKYFQMGAIDRQALLENTGYPEWKKIIERVGEGQLGQALQVLIQAGLPEEIARQLYQELMQSQGGPGNGPQEPTGQKTVSPGVPKGAQGGSPPAHVVRGEG